MTPLSVAAHGYLAAGFRVIALVGKMPHRKFHRHGLLDALSGVPESDEDNALIEQVFADPETTGIGIVVDYPYVVVDVDGEEGAVALRDLIGSTNVDRTPVARTARGLHIWYFDLTPRRSGRLGTKLDLKAAGGYVAAPPSQHPDGPMYEWLVPLIADEGCVREVPDAIREQLDHVAQTVEDFTVEQRKVGRLVVDGKAWHIEFEPASIEGLVKHVRALQSGNRNNGLVWAAFTARDEGFPLAEALSALVPAAIESGLDAHEARKAIRSAYRSKA